MRFLFLGFGTCNRNQCTRLICSQHFSKSKGELRLESSYDARSTEDSYYYLSVTCPGGKKQALYFDEASLSQQSSLDWSGQKGYFTRLYTDKAYRAKVAKLQKSAQIRAAAPSVCFSELTTSGKSDRLCATASNGRPKLLKVVGTSNVTSDLSKCN